jgi:hypothetical protein
VNGSQWTSSSGQSSLVAPVGASSDIGNNFYSLISMLGRKCGGYTAHQFPIKFNDLNLSKHKLISIFRNQLIVSSIRRFIVSVRFGPHGRQSAVDVPPLLSSVSV